MKSLMLIVLMVAFMAINIWIVKLIIDNATNRPTREGLVISVLLGLLGVYLILCWFGWMGEERDDD